MINIQEDSSSRYPVEYLITTSTVEQFLSFRVDFHFAYISHVHVGDIIHVLGKRFHLIPLIYSGNEQGNCWPTTMDKMQAFFFGLANMKKEMYSMCLFFSLYLKDVRF